MTLRLMLAASVLITGCAATQKMHFAAFSPVDFSLSGRGVWPGLTDGIGRVTASGGDYSKGSEFGDYSWHGFVVGHYESWHGFVVGHYEGFHRLPYFDPSREVETWMSDLLQANGLMVGGSARSLHVFVRRLKMKTQQGFGHDYRACLVTLNLVVRDTSDAVTRETTAQGVAKLRGSKTVIDRGALGLAVMFGPDDPPVCKLATANALRAAAR
jgi:hypothetical protein